MVTVGDILKCKDMLMKQRGSVYRFKKEDSCLHVGCKLKVIEVINYRGITYRCRVLEGEYEGRTLRMIQEKIKDIKKNNLRW